MSKLNLFLVKLKVFLLRFYQVFLTKPLYNFLIILGIIFFVYYLLYHHKIVPGFTNVMINNQVILAKIADTENERSLGLSYTLKLDENTGMLFVFDKVGMKNFWMRDMNYNIDIIWIDENKNVVGFVENADKNSYNQSQPHNSRIYRSPENTKYVLEINAGSIEKLKIKVGDQLHFTY